MSLLQQSLVFSWLVLAWDRVILLYQGSLFSSAVDWLWRLFQRGFFYRLFHSPSRLESGWTNSLFYRFLSFSFNLPRALFGRFRQCHARIFDESLFCALLRFLGRCTPYYMGAYLCLILVVPYSRWNNMYSLILSIFGLLLFWLSSLSDESQRIDLSKIGPWPTLFATVTCLSLIWSQDFSISLRFLFFTLTCILTVVVVVSSIRTERQLFNLLVLLGLGLLLCSLYGIYQSYVGVEASTSFTDLDINADMPGRVFSFFKNPNAFANLLVFFIPLMAALIFYSPSWRDKLFFLGVTGLACLALLFTFSRGGWLSLLISFFVLALCLCPRWVPLFVLLGLLALPFLPDTIKARILSIFAGDSSISSRNYIYSAVVRLLKDNWFFGVGLGTSALKRGISYFDVYHATFPFVHAHNILLEIWAESGIFAALSFICTICASFIKGFAARKRAKTPLLRAIIAGSVSGLVGSMVFGLTDYAWAFPRIMVLFWFLFAILYAAIKLSKKTDTIKKEGLSHDA